MHACTHIHFYIYIYTHKMYTLDTAGIYILYEYNWPDIFSPYLYIHCTSIFFSGPIRMLLIRSLLATEIIIRFIYIYIYIQTIYYIIGIGESNENVLFSFFTHFLYFFVNNYFFTLYPYLPTSKRNNIRCIRKLCYECLSFTLTINILTFLL